MEGSQEGGKGIVKCPVSASRSKCKEGDSMTTDNMHTLSLSLTRLDPFHLLQLVPFVCQLRSH
jgi:hypothetical protein